MEPINTKKKILTRDLMISLAEISIDLRANATSISKSLDNLHLKNLLNSDWLKEWCILSPEIFYGHAIFTGGNSKKDSRYLCSPVYRVWWMEIWLQFEQHYSDSVSFFSLVKDSPANTIKVSAAISLFDRCDSDKPEKINISLLSGCCL